MKTILVVEDIDDDVFFLKRALRHAEITNPVHVVIDGQQALDYLEGRGEYATREKYPLPFLILLDLKLPYVMGLDVLKWIRQKREFDSTWVAVLTSSEQDSDISSAYRLGCNAYLTKPPSREKLLEFMRNFGEEWAQRAGLAA